MSRLRLKGEVSHPSESKVSRPGILPPTRLPTQLFFNTSPLCPVALAARQLGEKCGKWTRDLRHRRREKERARERFEWALEREDGGGLSQGMEGAGGKASSVENLFKLRYDFSRQKSKAPYNWRRWKSTATLKTSPHTATLFHRRSFVRRLNFRSRRKVFSRSHRRVEFRVKGSDLKCKRSISLV